MIKPKRIPKKVLAEAVKKAGTFLCYEVREYLDAPINGCNLSSFRIGLGGYVWIRARSNCSSGFHYSPYKQCVDLTLDDFVECWSGDPENPTITRHKVGNCKVKK